MGDGLTVFVIMALGAFIPFGLIGYWVRAGRLIPALAFSVVVGAGLLLLVWGADGRLGLDPMIAISWAMLFFVPATIGAFAGILLGWVMRRRDSRRTS